jgi:hypothetical protein
MEQSQQEFTRTKKDIGTKIRDRIWTSLEKSSLSQETKNAWVELLQSVASKLDAPKLAKVRTYVETHKTDLAKNVAISSAAMDIVASVASFGTSVAVVGSSRMSEKQRDSSQTSPITFKKITIPALEPYQKKALQAGSLLVGVGGATLAIRPAERLARFSAQHGKKIAERVAGAINTIALRQEKPPLEK